MTLTRPTVLPTKCCLHLAEHAFTSIYKHFIWQIKMICKHIMSVMISNRRSIKNRGHLLRCKKCGIFTWLSPTLIFHLISGRYNQIYILLHQLIQHSCPTGLVRTIRWVPSFFVALSIFLDLRITCEAKLKLIFFCCLIAIDFRPCFPIIIGHLILIFRIFCKPVNCCFTYHFPSVSIFVFVYLCRCMKFLHRCFHYPIPKFHNRFLRSCRRIPIQIHSRIRLPRLKCQVLYRNLCIRIPFHAITIFICWVN